ncbi:MAG: hypothetical protein AAF933_12050 [Pseudomonadota bacterium]
MIKTVLRTASMVLLAVSALPLWAERLSDAHIERYIASHQDGCVAALTGQVQNAGYTLPFGFVDNFCLCMGKAMFDGMTRAQERELNSVVDGELPKNVLLRQTRIREECATTTAELFVSDLRDTSN